MSRLLQNLTPVTVEFHRRSTLALARNLATNRDRREWYSKPTMSFGNKRLHSWLLTHQQSIYSIEQFPLFFEFCVFTS
jgi:hypothetical protein